MFFTPITKALSIGTVSLCRVHNIIGMVDLISCTTRIKSATVGPGIVWSVVCLLALWYWEPRILITLKLQLNWKTVLIATSATSLSCGIAMLTLVPDGPYITTNSTFDGKIIFTIFKQKEVKATALGYFGPM